MIKNIKQYWLVGLLILIALWMGVAKIRYRNVDWDNVSGLITPTVMPTRAPQINADYPLWELLPYAGKDFVVDRYSEANVLVIKTGEKIELIEEEVYKWMRENNVATESHKLIFEKE